LQRARRDAKVAEGLGFGVGITVSNDQIIETLAGFAAVAVTQLDRGLHDAEPS